VPVIKRVLSFLLHLHHVALVVVVVVVLILPKPTGAFRRTPRQVLSSPEQLLYRQQQQDERQRRRHRQLLKHDPIHVPVPTDPNDHLVKDLPLLETTTTDEPLTHWAGHLPVASGDKYLFYWLFAPPSAPSNNNNDDDDDSVPLIIWLNGGPACSSMDGLFLENGPIQWYVHNNDKNSDDENGTYRLRPNPYSWHLAPAYTLYIDQPVGTGLSFTTSGTYPSNDREVNEDFYAWLQQFFTLHADKFVKDGRVFRKVYFSGESHAGHYIPSMMNYILQQNDKHTDDNDDSIIIPLAGAAIGNGWVDPYYQYAAAQAAYGHGLLGRGQVNALDARELQCQAQLKAGRYTASVCFDLLDAVVDQSYGSRSPYKVSQYDVRRAEPKHGERHFPPGYKVTEAYLGGWPHSGGRRWKIGCRESKRRGINRPARHGRHQRRTTVPRMYRSTLRGIVASRWIGRRTRCSGRPGTCQSTTIIIL